MVVGRWVVGRDRWVDLVIWVAAVVPVFVPGQALPDGAPLSVAGFRLVAVLVLTSAVAISRVSPAASALAPPVLALLGTGQFYSDQLLVAQLLLAFLLGRRTAGLRAARDLASVVACVGVLHLALHTDTPDHTWLALASGVLLQIVFPWTAGQLARHYAALVADGWELAERLEHEQALVAEQVRIHERTRIAGDMHDSLGHELSLIALRAAALRVRTDIGEDVRAATEDLRRSAEEATLRLRDIVSILGEEEPPTVVPHEDSIEALVQRAVASGMEVTLVDTAAGPAPAPATARAAYRTVQEALTNAAKHAPGEPVSVAIGCDDTDGRPSLVVTIANPTPPGVADPTTPRGYGLVGLQERVRLAGGTLTIEHTPGAFRTSARLPLTEAAVPARAVPAPGSYALRAEADARRRLRSSMIGALWTPVAMSLLLTLVYLLSSTRR